MLKKNQWLYQLLIFYLISEWENLFHGKFRNVTNKELNGCLE
jgi:hypothetical protein